MVLIRPPSLEPSTPDVREPSAWTIAAKSKGFRLFSSPLPARRGGGPKGRTIEQTPPRLPGRWPEGPEGRWSASGVESSDDRSHGCLVAQAAGVEDQVVV